MPVSNGFVLFAAMTDVSPQSHFDKSSADQVKFNITYNPAWPETASLAGQHWHTRRAGPVLTRSDLQIAMESQNGYSDGRNRWSSGECRVKGSGHEELSVQAESMNVRFDFYSDFEALGEKGIQFLRGGGSGDPEAFHLWVGFFDSIMTALFDLYSKKQGVEYFQLLEEWNECKGYASVEGDPSILQDLPTTIDALKKLSREARNKSAAEIKLRGETEINSRGELDSLIGFLQEAIDANLTVSVKEL